MFAHSISGLFVVGTLILGESFGLGSPHVKLPCRRSAPCIHKFDFAELPTGCTRPWVARSSGGLLALSMIQNHLDTARLMTQGAPLVFESGVFVHKNVTAGIYQVIRKAAEQLD